MVSFFLIAKTEHARVSFAQDADQWACNSTRRCFAGFGEQINAHWRIQSLNGPVAGKRYSRNCAYSFNSQFWPVKSWPKL